MEYSLNVIDRIRLELFGSTYIGVNKKSGWKNSVPFYLYKCPKHGIVTTYAKGHKQYLTCPKCLEELHQVNLLEPAIVKEISLANTTT